MTTKHLSHPKMHRRYNQTYAEENETQFPNHQSLNDSECLTKERPLKITMIVNRLIFKKGR
ncbi:hypothetical protein NFD60_12755 (plasmid) [Staphylococcus epidermidis]|nr:hypothetical protein NFD60_12755 [Staphylococcus epidermidis]